jgi:3-(3-hydroxy-phenyl)propionate hydroxylase
MNGALQLANAPIPVETLLVARTAGGSVPNTRTLIDIKGVIASRYDARDGTVYLARPDQHVAARWRAFDLAQIKDALARATGNARGGAPDAAQHAT